MAKGTMKYYFIILGLGIGLTISGVYFTTNPQVEYRYKEYSDEEILERAAEIKLEEAKEKALAEEDDEIEEDNTNNEDEIQEPDEETEEGTEQEIDEETNQENETDNDVDTEQTGNEENIDNTNDTENTEDVEENQEDNGEEIDRQSQENSPSGEGLTEETGQTQEDDTAEYRSVRIYYGDSSETVVHKLYKEGIIQDKKAFNRYVRENNAEKKLLPGVYDLRVDMDYREILNELMHIVE